MSELAPALETSWPSAQRLEDPKHWPTLRQLEKAASALGKRLVLSFEWVMLPKSCPPGCIPADVICNGLH